jgi:hypothetical protein
MNLPSNPFPSGFPTKTLYTLLPFAIRARCPAHLILIYFITRTIVGEEYRSLSSSLWSFLHSPDTSFLLGPSTQATYSPNYRTVNHVRSCAPHTTSTYWQILTKLGMNVTTHQSPKRNTYSTYTITVASLTSDV